MDRMKLLSVALGGLLLAACGGSDAAKTSAVSGGTTPTSVATSTAAAPSPSPSATVPATTTAAATAQPSATPVPSPTAEPTRPAPPAVNTPVPLPATPVPPAPTATPVPQGAPASVTVSAEAIVFSPATVTIRAGGSVTWVWASKTYHTVTGQGFASDTTNTGPYSRAFPSPGTYAYSCEVHPDTMRGTVSVQ